MALLSIAHNLINQPYNYSLTPSTAPHSVISPSAHPCTSIFPLDSFLFCPSFANSVRFKASVLCFLHNNCNTASVFSPANIAIFVVHIFSSSFGYIFVAFHISVAVSLISFVIFNTSPLLLSPFSNSSNNVPIT